MHKRKGCGARQRSYQGRIPAAIRFARGPQKLAMILCVMSVSLTAQWPNHPTPGMPRTPDGKPNLSAPAPRSADGKPDLSGVWLVKNGSFCSTHCGPQAGGDAAVGRGPVQTARG